MPNLEWLLAFGQITFPVFLLIPALITSFRTPIPARDLGRFFVILWVDYGVIVLGSALGVHRNVMNLAFLIFSVVLIGIALFYVMRWTLQEQIHIELGR